MNFKPYPYQQTAVDWVVNHPRCALFLDCGLGKSVVTLTAILRLIGYCEINSALVVAPKKVAETTWTAEASKWNHLRALRVVKVMGTEKQRLEALARKADVYVIGRDSFVWLCAHFKGTLPYDMLVLDELTSFKSSKSRRFKAMRVASASAERVVGLTGTPTPNGLVDLWAQLYCIDRGERLGKSVTRYRETFFNLQRWNNIVIRCTPKAGSEEAIRTRIADICLTMQARDYLTLPPLWVHTEHVELDAKTAKAYADFEREKVLEFAKTQGTGQTVLADSAAALMNKLSQFANGAVYDELRGVHELHEAKLERLAELVEAANSPVLVFYQFRHDIPRILGRFKTLRARVYEGAKDLEDWNAGAIDVLLAHPASTAYGLNMQQGGHYIVWFGTGWNLELFQQANARLYRQGQPHPVIIYKLVVKGTVDERAAAALESKRSLQQSLLDALGELTRKHIPQAT